MSCKEQCYYVAQWNEINWILQKLSTVCMARNFNVVSRATGKVVRKQILKGLFCFP